MEANSGRELISRRPGPSRTDSSNGKTVVAKNHEDSETEIRALSKQTSKTNDAVEPRASGSVLDSPSSVEYTRNANYKTTNGELASPDHSSRFAIWRAQSDQAMIKCIKEDNTHQTYFTRPPVNLITLFFEDHQIEKDYRKKAWQSRSERRLSHGQAGLIMEGAGSPHHGVHTRTWSPSGFTAVFDLVVSMLTFVIICLGKIYI